MNMGKPTHFDVAVNTKELHLDLFYRSVGMSPALVASLLILVPFLPVPFFLCPLFSL
jgi:hypothetical protein